MEICYESKAITLYITNLRKMTGNSPNLDLVNVNARTKFSRILSISSQDIEWTGNAEQNSDLSQGP